MNRIQQLARRAHRWFMVHLRRVVAIDEDTIRDQLIGGLERDRESVVNALVSLATKHAELAAASTDAFARLALYEASIPQLGKLRRKYDSEKKKAEKKAAREKAAQEADGAEPDRTQMHPRSLEFKADVERATAEIDRRKPLAMVR